jgi:hypothetical protein
LSLVAATVSAADATLDTERIDQLTGLKKQAERKRTSLQISFPRDDIAVSVDGWKIPAFMGLTTWASFTISITQWGVNACAAFAGSDENSVVDGDFA